MSSEMIRMEFTREEMLAMKQQAVGGLARVQAQREQAIDDALFYQHWIDGLVAWLAAAERVLAQEEAGRK